MNRVPRASFSITILTDEDYRVLMGLKGGLETFGIFASIVIVGRERLQEGKARQLSGSESLIFDNSLTHVLEMARVTPKKFNAALSVLADVAKETGSKPWMSLDRSGHVVIRSFFKFNTNNANTNWGGPRPGSGRPPSENQDDSEKNQDETKMEPSWCASDSSSSSSSITKPPYPPGGGAAGASESKSNGTLFDTGPPPAKPERKLDGLDETVDLAEKLFSPEVSKLVRSKGKDIAKSVRGEHATTEANRFACYRAALREMKRRQSKAGSTDIGDPHAFAMKCANSYGVKGIPVVIEASSVPASIKFPASKPLMSPEIRRELAERNARLAAEGRLSR